jgi:glutathione synthase/RimK-type ligase-like ATP-grasp enzyme
MNVNDLKNYGKRISSEWEQFNKQFVVPKGHNKFQLFADYIICVFKYHITYSEYFYQYKFHTLSKAQRSEFITISEAHKIEKAINKGIRDFFWYKDRFLQRFPNFTKREWLNLNNASAEEFIKFCQRHPRFIIKPIADSRGAGVRLITINNVEDIAGLYNQLYAGNYIAEELVTACNEIAQFNPQSLNTIRVVTYQNGEIFKPFGSFFRLGLKGSTVDNAHAGGVFAKVDVETGKVVTEGINTNGERFANHPTSHIPIVGFQIPRWNEIIQTCRDAAMSLPEAKLVGWDIAIRQDYSIVIIEGNHMPDFDVMQSPAQRGIKKEFLEVVGM